MSSFTPKSVLLLVAVWLLLAVTAAPGAKAETISPWVANDQGQVRLVSAVNGVGDGGQVQLGLQFRLNPGWKISWRSPGAAGYPPSIDWGGSSNLASAAISWPVPHRFDVSGLQTMGYKDEVVLPITARLATPGRPLDLRASVDYLTCSTICVPQHVDVRLAVPAGPADPSPQAHDISRFLATVPGDGAAHGLTLLGTETAGAGDKTVLRVSVAGVQRFEHPDVFVETADGIEFGPPAVSLSDGGRRAVLEVPVVPGTMTGSLVGRQLTVTVADGNRGLEAVVAPTLGKARGGADDLLVMLGFALLGGLILNLMPCVLPVLSLKVLGLVGHGGGERRQVRLSFVASSAGIVASFLGLAAAAVTVKAAGAAVGWGIQFQQPLFLVAMVTIITLFAANLWGLFEIPLPYWLAGVGRGHGNPHSLAGHFATGAFATLLATPCTAPFLGTAVGFALARGPAEVFAIFTALGIGMAAPYLLVAASPQLALRLPRPGRWMLVVRKVMGVALAATAVWLLTVLAAQLGTAAAVMVGAAMAVAGALLALRSRSAGAARPALAAAVAAVAGIAFVIPLQATSNSLPLPSAKDELWQPFRRDAIAGLVAEGQTVFVDVTADWCITCQVNKSTVINRGTVAKRLAAPGVVAMRADWTRPDEGIARYLAEFGRYGIPFNAVYGPGAPDGLPLPELLTNDAVLTALDKAAGKRD